MIEFFPCILVEHSTSFSIIRTNFHYFDSFLVKKVAVDIALSNGQENWQKEHQLTRDITFDSEVGMSSVSASNQAVLLKLRLLLREITGGEEQHKSCDSLMPRRVYRQFIQAMI